MKWLFWLIMAFLLVTSCKDEVKKTALPNTPEEVVLAWQAALDKNEFETARALSMEEAMEHVNFIDGIMEEDEDPLEEDENMILNLNCIPESDGRMRCEFVFEEEPESVEQVPRHVYLKKDGTQWKVQELDNLEAIDWMEEEEMEELLFPPEDSLDISH